MISVNAMISNSEFANTKPHGPERELLIATLDRAVLDYHSSRRELRQQAEEWLKEDAESSDTFSFTWVCEHLGLNARSVLQRIDELKFSSNVSQRHRWLRKKIQSRQREVAKAVFSPNTSVQAA